MLWSKINNDPEMYMCYAMLFLYSLLHINNTVIGGMYVNGGFKKFNDFFAKKQFT